MAFFFLIFGALTIGTDIYFQGKANDAQDVSSDISKPFIDHGGESKILMEAIDRKFELFRAEIKLRKRFLGLVGGALLGFGIGILLGYKSKKRINQMLENVLREIREKNS